MTDIVAAALAAVRHADALMPRTAAGPDESHTDWRPRWNQPSNVQKWHPPYGETHVKYHVYSAGGGRNPIIWGATHHGILQDTRTFTGPLSVELNQELTRGVYEHEDDPEQLGRFKTEKKAKEAAEQHYRDNYGTPPKHDYDIDSIMNDNPQAPAGKKRGLGDDEDYSRIFDAVRRALKKAGLALRRTAGGFDDLGEQFQDIMKPAEDPRAQQPGTAGLWHWYKNQHPERTSPQSLYDFATWHDRHIQPGTKQHAYDTAKGEVANDNDGQMPSWTSQWGHSFGPDDDDLSSWHDDVGDPANQESRGGIGYSDPQGNHHFQGDPISQPYGYNSEGFDPDDTQDPFDPRLMGASRLDPADIYRLAGDGLSYEDTMKMIDKQLSEGPQNEDPYASPHIECRYCDGPATHGMKNYVGDEFPVCESCLNHEHLDHGDAVEHWPIDSTH
jgi:hypothetical protein